MKYILEIILTTIIILFVWNIVKRLFFIKVFKTFNFPQNQQQQEPRRENQKKKMKEKIDWDAETVEYEEISDTKNTQTKK